MSLNIKSEGKISLMEAYSMPYQQRELYVKSYNEINESTSKSSESMFE